jgi:hypothetical protein
VHLLSARMSVWYARITWASAPAVGAPVLSRASTESERGWARQRGLRLEDVTSGARIAGVAGDCPMTVVAMRWIGSNALRPTYRTDDGSLDERYQTRT